MPANSSDLHNGQYGGKKSWNDTAQDIRNNYTEWKKTHDLWSSITHDKHHNYNQTGGN